MMFKKSLKYLKAFIKAFVLRQNMPLAVGWAITNFCNHKCVYCGRWKGEEKELTTEEALKVIDELSLMGTIRISLTGGEPLIRLDIGKIINYIHSKNIEVKLNSNGSFIRERLAAIKSIDVLSLSLEGPKNIHDTIRGEGSYDEVIDAISCAKENGISFSLATVITNKNLDSFDFLIEKAKEFKTKVLFQPATQVVLGQDNPNPLALNSSMYKVAIEKLIKKKKKNKKVIKNSLRALNYMSEWPNLKKIKCATPRVSCRIEPNGDLIYCSRATGGYQYLNCREVGVKRAYSNLKEIECNQCLCAPRLELNFLLQDGFLSFLGER